MFFGLWRDGHIHWSTSIWRRFLQPDAPPPSTPTSNPVNHNCTVSLFTLFTSVTPLFFCFFLFYSALWLYRVADVHWSSTTLRVSHSSHVSPISYTPQEGWTDREKEGESEKREKGGGGGEWGIWYALCMSDLYKTKTVYMCVCIWKE